MAHGSETEPLLPQSLRQYDSNSKSKSKSSSQEKKTKATTTIKGKRPVAAKALILGLAVAVGVVLALTAAVTVSAQLYYHHNAHHNAHHNEHHSSHSSHASASKVAPTALHHQERTATRAPTGRFLHITDIHIDLNFKAGTPYPCHGPLDGNSTLLAGSGRRRTTKGDGDDDEMQRLSGFFGLPGAKCDTSLDLAKATFAWIREEIRKNPVDFVVWTGDSARHDNDLLRPRTVEEIVHYNAVVVDMMKETFGKDGPIGFVATVPNIGNNDIKHHNVLAAPPNEMLGALYGVFHELLPSDQHEQFLSGGYFVQKIDLDNGNHNKKKNSDSENNKHLDIAKKKKNNKKKNKGKKKKPKKPKNPQPPTQPPAHHQMWIVSLNTMYFFTSNTEVDGCYGKSDPGTVQLEWLHETLHDARENGAVVILMGHVAPVIGSYYPKCAADYSAITVLHKDVIRGQLFGHSNIDHYFFLGSEEPMLMRNGNDNHNSNNKQQNGRYHPFEVNAVDPHYCVHGSQAALNDPRCKSAFSSNERVDSLQVDYMRASLAELKYHYSAVAGKDGDTTIAKKLTVANVSPSVIPLFQPSLRFFDYVADPPAQSPSPSPEHPSSSSPLDSTDIEIGQPYGQFLGYTQYWMNLTDANERAQQCINRGHYPRTVAESTTVPDECTFESLVKYTPLYSTSVDYGMKDLSVSEYIKLAYKLINSPEMWGKFINFFSVTWKLPDNGTDESAKK